MPTTCLADHDFLATPGGRHRARGNTSCYWRQLSLDMRGEVKWPCPLQAYKGRFFAKVTWLPSFGILWEVSKPTTKRREAMFCQAGFDQWLTTIMQHLSPLSKPQATVLALLSFGMVLARSCALSAVSSLLAAGMQRNAQTVRQRLREWYYDTQRKRGAKRQALRVETCFAPLLGGVVSAWQGTQLAWALDATTLGDRFVVLAVSVVYRGCAIPVAWVILPAGQKHAWRGEWLRLLRRLWRVVPRHWTVIVLADRGLYAPWLFRRIVKLGWHPFLRINTGGTFRPAGTRCFRPLRTFVPQTGTRWQGRGTAFTGKPRRLD